LHGAAATGNIGLVQYALRNGQPINAVLGGLLPLHAAACGGSVEVIKLLLDHGADVNAPRLPSSMGPPIGVGGAGSMVGPTGIIDDSHHHVLHHHHTTGTSAKGRAASAGGGHPQPPVTPMTRPGSSNNNGQSLPVGKRDSTPLHFAAALGHLDAVRLLLDKGANPAAKDVEKSTPEIVARLAGKTRIAERVDGHRGYGGCETKL
jgi:ankyrin repeat protein